MWREVSVKKKTLKLRLDYTYFVEYPTHAEGHRKTLVIGSEQPDCRYEIEVCECVLDILKQDLKIFEDWVKSGKLKIPKKKKEYGEKSYIG